MPSQAPAVTLPRGHAYPAGMCKPREPPCGTNLKPFAPDRNVGKFRGGSMKTLVGILGAGTALLLTGCYGSRPSNGGGQISAGISRTIRAEDIALPSGYRVEAVARGLTFPVAAAFDDQGRLHIVESGYCYGEVWTTPRLLRIENDGRTTVVASGGRNGPWTGVAFHDGAFFIAEGGVLEGGKMRHHE